VILIIILLLISGVSDCFRQASSEVKSRRGVINRGTILHKKIDEGIEDKEFYSLLSENIEKIDQTNGTGQTPLLYALLNKRELIANKLLVYGAKSDTVDSKGNTPLLIALNSDYYYIAKKLIERKSTINIIDNTLGSPLHITLAKKNLLFTQQLIEAGADVNFTNSTFSPLIQIAIEQKDSCFVSLLARSGARLDLKTCNGLRPLDYALHLYSSSVGDEAKEMLSIIRALIKNDSNVNVENSKSLHNAVKLFINSKDNFSIIIIEKLLKKELNVINAIDEVMKILPLKLDEEKNNLLSEAFKKIEEKEKKKLEKEKTKLQKEDK